MEETDDSLKLHRDLIIACGWGKEVDVILLLQQGASVRVQDQVCIIKFDLPEKNKCRFVNLCGILYSFNVGIFHREDY